MKKTPQIFINKPVYLGLSILEIIKVVIHAFWYDNARTGHGKIAKLCKQWTQIALQYI